MVKSAYIHIPFCIHICSYCDFCKMYYNKELVLNYLKELKKEINNNYKNEVLDTIYIGGGTPSSLDIFELEELLNICDIFKRSNNYEFTVECNIENITEEKLKLMQKKGVNRLSVGVESFNSKHLTFMERHHTKEDILETMKVVKKYFDNINIDLIYALENQTIEELNQDLDAFLELDIPHISTYSLIVEPNTKLGITNTESIDQDLDDAMFKQIKKRLKEKGYIHYETSNFSKSNYESKHNLTYWNNQEYYGFGLGASGFTNNKRYDNTRSINKYLKGNYVLNINTMTKLEDMQNEMILGLRKTKGVSKQEFRNKYDLNIEDVFNIGILLEEKKLIDDGTYIFISEDYEYLANEILINFI